MRRAEVPRVQVLLVLLVSLATPVHAAPAPPEVKVSPIEAGRLLTVTVPGTLLHVAEACTAERCHGLLLLVKSPDKRSVYFLDPGAHAVEALAAELPPRSDALAVFDVDADGTSDVLAGEAGRLHHLGTLGEGLELGEPRLLLESSYFDLAALASGGFLEPPWIVVPALRDLEIFRADGGDVSLAAKLPLPHRARLEPGGLRLHTYPVTRLPVDGRTIYAVGPEAHGKRRLRTVLIEPDAADGEVETEAWSWLPASESVAGSWYVAANGRPALVVTTVQADRVGLFEKKQLRVFGLRGGDRSRAGTGPALEAETASHHWQDADPNFTDADGDGLLDLVLVQPRGMGGKNLVVEAYPGRHDAQFRSIPLRSVAKARRADAWHYGGDVDGDGVGDLVTRSGEVLQVFRGVHDSKKRSVLDDKPLWLIDLETGAPAPESEDEDEEDWEGRNERAGLDVRDVDRDGRAEVLVHSRRDGTSVLRIVDPL